VVEKKLPNSAEGLRRCIEREHNVLTVARQCELVGLARSTCYHRALGDSAENLALMRRIDEQYLRTPLSATVSGQCPVDEVEAAD